MVEVFKTDVVDNATAKKMIVQIHESFMGYKANFDLEDCNRILRIEYVGGYITASKIIKVLKNNGFNAEVLADDVIFDI